VDGGAWSPWATGWRTARGDSISNVFSTFRWPGQTSGGRSGSRRQHGQAPAEPKERCRWGKKGPRVAKPRSMARLGLSEELANAIVFIASDEASFITGHVLNADGGKSH
jgi:NAD(P)-dependent dehydrogenase (short-subunit alcohol dehydrogenase family)